MSKKINATDEAQIRTLIDVRVPELALQEVAHPASDQIRTGSARPPARDAEPESHHRHDVHGNGGKDTHNQANNESTAFHRTAFPPLLVRLLPNEKEISYGSVSWQARSFDKEFAAPVGWVGIENRLRERPRMPPWVEERALAFAIHVVRGFSENTSTGCLDASKEFVDLRDTKCAGVRPRALRV